MQVIWRAKYSKTKMEEKTKEKTCGRQRWRWSGNPGCQRLFLEDWTCRIPNPRSQSPPEQVNACLEIAPIHNFHTQHWRYVEISAFTSWHQKHTPTSSSNPWMPKGEVRGLAKGEERKRSSMSGPDDTIGGTVEPEREHWMHKNWSLQKNLVLGRRLNL